MVVSEKETEVGTEEENVTEIKIEGMTETEIVTTTATEKMSELFLQAVIKKCLSKVRL